MMMWQKMDVVYFKENQNGLFINAYKFWNIEVLISVGYNCFLHIAQK
jgi:hypothetical protein